jgi:enamine deaminase RidA (YjgF/YER057c/UK114 family)
MKVFPAAVALTCAFVLIANAQRKKKEEETQTLELPKELPAAVIGETRRLNFYVTPLSAKGLLSQQIRDALKAADSQSGRDTVLKIRAFVAGSGDLRRVRDLVSEIFTDRRQPLPVLSLIRAGGLPLEGAQVVLETIASSRREVNPSGLAFIAAHPAVSGHPLDPVAPLTEKTLASLRRAIKAAGSEPGDALRVTCFLSSLEDLAASRKLVAAEYPRAAVNFVQTQRAPSQALAACEGVARLRGQAPATADFPAVQGWPAEPGVSPVVRVGARRLVLTGSQVSFGYEEKDARLAFARLGKALEQAGGTLQDVVWAHYYPLAGMIAAQVSKVRPEYFDASRPPASSTLIFEGLPSMDAGFALDAVAVRK